MANTMREATAIESAETDEFDPWVDATTGATADTREIRPGCCINYGVNSED